MLRTVVGDFLATTDDSGELMDTFHLFGDETAGGKGDGAGVGSGAGGEGGSGDGGEEGAGTASPASAAGGQSVAKLKTLDGEAFCSCLEMCFEHMVSEMKSVQVWKAQGCHHLQVGLRGGGPEAGVALRCVAVMVGTGVPVLR